jgi:hypothetical protein
MGHWRSCRPRVYTWSRHLNLTPRCIWIGLQSSKSAPDSRCRHGYAWDGMQQDNESMTKRWSIWFVCPVCATAGQSFGLFASLSRHCTTKCAHCGHMLVSELSVPKYFLFMFFANVVLAIVGVPLILGLLTKRWILATGMAVIFLLCVVPVGMLLHGRNAMKCEPQDVKIRQGR